MKTFEGTLDDMAENVEQIQYMYVLSLLCKLDLFSGIVWDVAYNG